MRLVVGLLTILSFFVASANAWGADGHEIVATIAQTQLHPDVRAYLCAILPTEQTAYKSFYPHSNDGKPHEHCHLAPLAAWADRVRQTYPWASHLHYVNPVHDEPPQHCAYGQYGWQDHGTGNVLEALVNFTSQLVHADDKDVALRFVTHFMGDIHQPLHLTGRARGGNDVPVRFNGRYARLHTVWDSLLIDDQIRQLANYTTPLPSARIESALRGKRYDAYVRWILAEGMGQAVRRDEPAWWRDEMQQWTECPPSDSTNGKKKADDGRAHWLRSVAPHSSRVAARIYGTIFRTVADEAVGAIQDPSTVDNTDLPLCPYAWTKPMHELVCSYAFASPVPPIDEDHHRAPLQELNVPEYAGRIDDDKIIHRQLARAGIRLAAVLNTILLPDAQRLRSTITPAARISYRVDSTSKTLAKHPKHGGHHSGGQSSPIWGLIKVTASSIAEVVILSSIGYILARQGVLDKRTQTRFNKINVSFFTPALLFSKVAFSLDPGRLAELIIVPFGFVIITVVSALAALTLSWVARLPRSQRNFSVACAITPNSNSLPVALMQSLVVTVPQLHWEEEGEPEDTVNSMLGRALTYLVLFSTLGMFLRWSLASQLLSTMDESENEIVEEPVTGAPPAATKPQTGQLVDVDEPSQQSQANVDSTTANDPSITPAINVRRSTEEGGGSLTITRQGHRRRPGWARSFPNSPGDSEDEDEDDEQSAPLLSPRWQRRRRSYTSSLKRAYRLLIVRPFFAFTGFMTMPLYAAVLSLIVALIPPLQSAISKVEPLVGALETAGACSIPLTMVVLGAYFYEEADTSSSSTNNNGVLTVSSTEHSTDSTTTWPSADSANATLVNPPAGLNRSSAEQHAKRKSLPFMRNPWKSGSASSTSRNGSVGDAYSDDAGNATEEDEQAQSWLFSSSSSTRRLSSQQRKTAQRITMERRTVFVAVASRMLLTPLLLLPLLAWYAIATRYNVVDDPVFITSACLLIGSPPALTLAQITSQSAKGSNNSFERLISKTIFVSYAIAATPTTIILVMTALLIAENDH